VIAGDGALARTAAVLIAVASFAPSAALAQGRAGFRPVFGGSAPPDADARASLNVSLALAQAFDQDLLADAGAASQPGVQASGMYTSLTPLVGLTTHGRRLGFSLNGTSNLRRYEVGRLAMMNYDLAGGLSADLGRRTTIVANQAMSYAPSYLYALFGDAPTTPVPGEPIAGAPDYKTSSFKSYTYATNAALSHAFSPRASFSVDGSMRRTDFVGNVAGVGDMQWSAAGAHYRHRLNGSLVLNVGYSRWESRDSLIRTTEHDLQSGIGFTHVLSATRKTTFGFNVGPTLSEIKVPIAGQWAGRGGHYRVVGDAFVEREIGRTWSTRAAYRRALTYIEGLAGPAYADSANVTTGGFVNRRTDLSFSAAYVRGEMASTTIAAAPFTTYMGNTRVRIGLSRNLAAFVDGLFYEYAFDPRLIVLPGVPPQFSRAGVRVGLTLWSAMTSERHAAR
jgi:hypothetical protein